MIKVIDAICGAGKTSYAIEYVNTHPEETFIYITPFLREVERLKKSCPLSKFIEPTNEKRGRKFDNFHSLLKHSRNIVATHALFRMATQETKDLIEAGGYTLVLDEVMDVLEELPLKRDDLPTILSQELAHIDDQGVLIWDKPDYDGRYNDIKVMCENHSLFVVNGCVLMWTFPAEVFASFKNVVILTYMFDAQIQRYYYDLHGVEYEYYGVRKNEQSHYELCEYTKPCGAAIADLIEIYEGKLNSVGDKEFSMSKTWYDRNRKTGVGTLKANIYNYFFNVLDVKSKDTIWTTFKQHYERTKGKGYTKGFLASNARATNEYRDRYAIAYPINKYITPTMVHFFKQRGIEVDQDKFALSEMIQFIFRSRLRTGQKVWIYIPSERSRDLLKGFLLLRK